MGRRRHDDPSVAGLLRIDKPAGLTSHDVVARVRRALRVSRVGHSGTLDPAATGLLLVGVGWVTRVLRFTGTLPKTYVADVTFGTLTSTLDAEGEVVERCLMDVRPEVLETALAGFVGEGMQVPPMVSAIKVGGEKLYEAARRGEEIEREPRPITVYSLDLLAFDGTTARIEVVCSAGTYVRVLAADLGRSLGGCAHLSALRRVAIGPHHVDDAVMLDGVTRESMLPAVAAVSGMECAVADEETADDVRHGRPLRRRLTVTTAFLDTAGNLLGVYEPGTVDAKAVCVAPSL